MRPRALKVSGLQVPDGNVPEPVQGLSVDRSREGGAAPQQPIGDGAVQLGDARENLQLVCGEVGHDLFPHLEWEHWEFGGGIWYGCLSSTAAAFFRAAGSGLEVYLI